MGDTGGAGSGPGGGSGTGPGRDLGLFGSAVSVLAATLAGYTSRPFSIESGTYGYEPARIPESAAAEYVARQLRTRRAAA